MREFTVESRPGITFREARVSPIDLLAITTQVDFDEYKKNKELFKFALEHLECEIEGKWLPVKTADREVYMPFGIERNYKALNELVQWYLENVIIEVFTGSAESTNGI